MNQTSGVGLNEVPLVQPGSAAPSRSFGRIAPAIPGAIALFLLFIAPMAFMVVFSFWRTDVDFNLVPDWNLNNYLKFFTVPTYLRTFLKTMLMATAVTAAGLGAAVPFTYFLVRYVSRRRQRLVLLAVIVPFWTSYLLRVYAWQAILGERGALNQARQGLDAILDVVGRPLGDHRPARRGAEQVAGVEGDHAVAEVALGEVVEVRVRVVGLELDVLLPHAAVPFGGEGHGAEDFPAGGVGHGQRQAAIRMALGEMVHPGVLRAAGHDLRRALGGGVALKFHGGLSRDDEPQV